MKLDLRTLVLIISILVSVGCTSVNYTTPAGGVSISSLTDDDIAELLRVEPEGQFPARIAVARIQSSGYYSRTTNSFGSGRYSIVTVRDIEDEADFETLSSMPMVADVVALNRLLVPPELDSIKDLRLAAARLKTDLLLIYSIDTGFHVESTPLGPLSIIALGNLPNKQAHVSSTTSGALIDVRTGFIYGASESTMREEKRTNTWNTRESIDEARLKAEKTSFKSFVNGFEELWGSVIARYATTES